MTHLDWSGNGGSLRATVGPLAPCQHCGKKALLRHPVNGKPCHKVCEEAQIDRIPASTTSTTSTTAPH